VTDTTSHAPTPATNSSTGFGNFGSAGDANTLSPLQLLSLEKELASEQRNIYRSFGGVTAITTTARDKVLSAPQMRIQTWDLL
jgi:hypothetical protein